MQINETKFKSVLSEQHELKARQENIESELTGKGKKLKQPSPPQPPGKRKINKCKDDFREIC